MLFGKGNSDQRKYNVYIKDWSVYFWKKNVMYEIILNEKL